MFIRKYWIPLSVFLIAITSIGVYLLATQTPKEPIVIYKSVKPLPRETTETEVDESDTSQGGHVHADGTWHEGPHEVEMPVETPAAPEPFFSEAELAEIPEDMLQPDIPLPADLKNMDLQNWKQWTKKYQTEWKKYIHALDPAIERLRKESNRLFAALPPKNSPDYTKASAEFHRVTLEYNRVIVEQGRRLNESITAYQAAADAHSLARYGKK